MKRILRQTTSLLSAAVVAVATVALTAPMGMAGQNHSGQGTPTAGPPSIISSGLVAPQSLFIATNGDKYVSQNFAGIISRLNADGTTANLVTAEPGAELGAVSERKGAVYFSHSVGGPETPFVQSELMVRERSGQTRMLADLTAWDAANNPDGDIEYGIRGVTAECAAMLPPDVPLLYKGIVDSHPYATLPTDDGIYVADAGGNDILRVGYDGSVSLVAVIPGPAPLPVTAELAEGMGLPSCLAGSEFLAESVPTDVEMGADGWLYVTSLPGGPESPALGARGVVYKVNPESGEVALVASGFAGATNLAVSKKGTIYVAELFAGRVSYLLPGSDTPMPLLDIAAPGAVELKNDSSLYVTTLGANPVDPTAPPAPEGGTVTKFVLTFEGPSSNGNGSGTNGGNGNGGYKS